MQSDGVLTMTHATQRTVPSDLEIAQAASLIPVAKLAADLGLHEEEWEPYGRFKAKVHLAVRDRLAERPLGKYVVVTAITPTPLGEGKTTTSIGLAQGLHRIGKLVFACLRQPSMGPTFGIKGGAAGGGYAQVVPMEDLNLHLTGDIHAVSAAHNLLAAALDNHLYHGNALDLDPEAILLRRVVDLNDRALRVVAIGQGAPIDGVPRMTGYDIAVASEVMAILALASDLLDLRARLGRIVVGFSRAGLPITAEDLKAAGAMTVLLKDALMPNLLQTLEGSPVFIHAGPFANIAHGNSSVVADQLALRLADVVVTEAGFGADMGMEKFMDIKCRASGLAPDAVVLVATVRALKMHGGLGKVVAGKPLPPELTQENLPALEIGCANLAKHVQNARLFGVPVVVALNAFATDTPAEIAMVRRIALEAGAVDACATSHWADGGAGSETLARAVLAACEQPSQFRFLYDADAPVRAKIAAIATQLYGADGVDYEPAAEAQLARYEALGWDRLPVCMAKTHLSLSHDPKLANVPTGFRLPIREVRASLGAGFLYPLCGALRTMPGLPAHPAFEKVDLVDGRVVGLF
jgi:formate--tetrahydrofolate ligase